MHQHLQKIQNITTMCANICRDTKYAYFHRKTVTHNLTNANEGQKSTKIYHSFPRKERCMKTTQCTRFQFHHVEPLCLINKTCTWPTVAKVLVEPAISSYFHSLHAITVTIIFISYMLLSLVLFSFHTCYYRRQYHTVCNISLRQI